MGGHTVAVSTAPANEYWALLDHFFESQQKAVFSKVATDGIGKIATKALDPAVTKPDTPAPLTAERDPGFWSANDAKRDPGLQGLVKKHVGEAAKTYQGWVNAWVRDKKMAKGVGDKQIDMVKRLMKIV